MYIAGSYPSQAEDERILKKMTFPCSELPREFKTLNELIHILQYATVIFKLQHIFGIYRFLKNNKA